MWKLEKLPTLSFIFFSNWMKTKAWKHTQFSLLEFDVLYNYIQIIFCLSLVEFFILNDGIHKLNFSKMCFPKRKIGENWLIMTYYTVLDVIVERYGKSEHTQQWRLGADQFIAFQSIWLLLFIFFFWSHNEHYVFMCFGSHESVSVWNPSGCEMEPRSVIPAADWPSPTSPCRGSLRTPACDALGSSDESKTNSV